ncbi:MAG TPA: AbrB/MazE/SpoVT family DNA-binding domain-containing protein [Candidatus Dormibacteraeota bacterium]|jgi:AbrB family looped-hinge helix DNA binding protein|nr:AbrB/MazE/SpoVT family DNA-binding domain-containing protein [Candidatus Dormibacteraeota bacterium]
MQTTIDAAGRLVVPKSLRDALGVRPGQLLELEVRDGRLEIELIATGMRLETEGESTFAVPATPLPPLTAKQVRETLEQTRR